MIMLRHRSHSGARIDNRHGSHTLTSPAGVQETGCGTATACVPTRCPSRSWGAVPCCDVEPCNEGIGRRDLLYYADPARTTASPIRRMSTSVEDGWRESSRTPGHAPARRGASMGYPTLAASQRPPVLRQNLIPLG